MATENNSNYENWKEKNPNSTIHEFYKQNSNTLEDTNKTEPIIYEEKTKKNYFIIFTIVGFLLISLIVFVSPIRESLNFKNKTNEELNFTNRTDEIKQIKEYVDVSLNKLITEAYNEYLNIRFPNITNQEKEFYKLEAKKDLALIANEESEKIMLTVNENNLSFMEVKRVIDSSEFQNHLKQGIRNKYKENNDLVTIETKSNYPLLKTDLDYCYRSISEYTNDLPYDYYTKGYLKNNLSLEGYFHITILIKSNSNFNKEITSIVYFQETNQNEDKDKNYLVREFKKDVNTNEKEEINAICEDLIKTSKKYICENLNSTCNFEEYWGD